MEFVYIGKGDGDVSFKIGRTTRPEEERQRQHQTSNPSFKYYQLFRTESAQTLEKKLHDFFCSKRTRGCREWFELSLEDLSTARLIAETYEHEVLPLSREVADLSKIESSSRYIEVSGSLEADYLRLRELRQQHARIEQELELVILGLKIQIGSHAGIAGYVSWRSREERRFDSSLFKQAFPDLYEEFREPSAKRYFVVL